MPTINLAIDDNGRGALLINGVDMSSTIRKITIVVEPGKPPSIVAVLMGSVEVAADAPVAVRAPVEAS